MLPHAICFKLAPSQEALRSRQQWSDPKSATEEQTDIKINRIKLSWISAGNVFFLNQTTPCRVSKVCRRDERRRGKSESFWNPSQTAETSCSEGGRMEINTLHNASLMKYDRKSPHPAMAGQRHDLPTRSGASTPVNNKHTPLWDAASSHSGAARPSLQKPSSQHFSSPSFHSESRQNDWEHKLMFGSVWWRENSKHHPHNKRLMLCQPCFMESGSWAATKQALCVFLPISLWEDHLCNSRTRLAKHPELFVHSPMA